MDPGLSWSLPGSQLDPEGFGLDPTVLNSPPQCRLASVVPVGDFDESSRGEPEYQNSNLQAETPLYSTRSVGDSAASGSNSGGSTSTLSEGSTAERLSEQDSPWKGSYAKIACLLAFVVIQIIWVVAMFIASKKSETIVHTSDGGNAERFITGIVLGPEFHENKLKQRELYFRPYPNNNACIGYVESKCLWSTASARCPLWSQPNRWNVLPPRNRSHDTSVLDSLDG